MQYILDTADLKEIRHANEFYPIEGVTTNSIGSDTNRKVVIMVNKAKKAQKEENADAVEAEAQTTTAQAVAEDVPATEAAEEV